jgi:hypothetical protein
MTTALPAVDSTIDRMFPFIHLPLDRFFRIVSYSPILANQVVIMYNELQRDVACSDPVLQYTWQPRGGGRPGREEIAQAIQQAEDTIYRALKFSPSPRWFTDEVDLTTAHRWGFWPNGAFGLRTNNFHLIEPGVERYKYLGSPQVTYDDTDGDGYKETATLTLDSVGAGVIDANEISAFPPGYGPDPALEIRPLRVDFDSLNNQINITVARHLLARWDLQERLDAQGIDGMADVNFYLELDIYRHYTDPSQAVEIVWPCGGCGVCAACGVQTATGCFTITDPRNGLVRVSPARWIEDSYFASLGAGAGAWDVLSCIWIQTPARIKLHYRAGYIDSRLKRPLVEMAPELERAVAFLALSYLDREWLTCEQIRNLQAHWRLDLANQTSNAAMSNSFKLDPDLLACPFGTTRAALYAWRVIQPLMVGQAVLNV